MNESLGIAAVHLDVNFMMANEGASAENVQAVNYGNYCSKTNRVWVDSLECQPPTLRFGEAYLSSSLHVIYSAILDEYVHFLNWICIESMHFQWFIWFKSG